MICYDALWLMLTAIMAALYMRTRQQRADGSRLNACNTGKEMWFANNDFCFVIQQSKYPFCEYCCFEITWYESEFYVLMKICITFAQKLFVSVTFSVDHAVFCVWLGIYFARKLVTSIQFFNSPLFVKRFYNVDCFKAASHKRL